MFRFLGLPRFSGCLGLVTGYVIVAMIASLAMHLLRLGWQSKFGVTVING